MKEESWKARGVREGVVEILREAPLSLFDERQEHLSIVTQEFVGEVWENLMLV